MDLLRHLPQGGRFWVCLCCGWRCSYTWWPATGVKATLLSALEGPVVPVGQFGLIGASHLLLVVQQLNGDFRQVEGNWLGRPGRFFLPKMHDSSLCTFTSGGPVERTEVITSRCLRSRLVKQVAFSFQFSVNVGLIKVSVVFHTILFYHTLSVHINISHSISLR